MALVALLVLSGVAGEGWARTTAFATTHSTKPGKRSCRHPKGKMHKGKHRKRCRKRKAGPDVTPPASPVLTGTLPESPGSGDPRVLGSAEPGSEAALYTDPGCSRLSASGSAEELSSPGIRVTVPPGSTTSFYATAIDAAGNRSPCTSAPLTYVEAPVAIQSAPSLSPGFSPGISDYTVPCDGSNPVSVSVDAPHGAAVSVDGGPASGGTFSRDVPLQTDQEFDFSVSAGTYSGTYHVRCTPSDFPVMHFERFAQPSNRFYLIDPDVDPGVALYHWVVLFDDQGVPIWWAKPSVAPIDSKALSDGTIAWARWDLTGYEVHSLDGTLVRTIHAVGGPTDEHDLQQLPNGDVLILSSRVRDHVDLSAYGGPADTSVQDAVIQEIDPSGNPVWEWDSGDHVALAESSRWMSHILTGSPPYDIVHVNAVEPDGNDVLVSLRHTDAIFKIDKATGDIVWKLGGTTTPESLTVLSDPESPLPLVGQHDVRLLADGTVTAHDNGWDLRPPRAVRYAIDEQAHTATLLESISDPDVVSASCCGSARRSSSGSWLISWGANPLVEEFGSGGGLNFRLTLNAFSYRAFPVPNGLFTAADLRAGMDAQYPRP